MSGNSLIDPTSIYRLRQILPALQYVANNILAKISYTNNCIAISSFLLCLYHHLAIYCILKWGQLWELAILTSLHDRVALFLYQELYYSYMHISGLLLLLLKGLLLLSLLLCIIKQNPHLDIVYAILETAIRVMLTLSC